MPTKRTAEEAEAFIIESIKYWKEKELEKRIISLSNWAEKWRVSGERIETAAKIKIMESSISDMEKASGKNEKLGMDIDDLQAQIQKMYEFKAELYSSYDPLPKRKRKSNK